MTSDMPSAPIPDNEQERLAELHSYGLSHEAEQVYDDITFLASVICETPVALMSLIEFDRQWFKSRVGVEASGSRRDLAFCAHAIWDPTDLMVVDDAMKDHRFANNPMVTNEPFIRFYAGAPLLTETGNALGTLCVIDRKPRELTETQQEALKALSRVVMTHLENSKLLRDPEADAA